MVGRFCFAGRVFELNTVYEFTHLFCRGYETDAEPEYHITISRREILQEADVYERTRLIEGRDNYPNEAIEEREAYLETLAVYRKITELLLHEGVFLMHGSVLAVDGEGYLFTAKSGTGKSTHTRLWREYFGDRAIMINDDKPLIEVREDKVIAYGTPWNGKHHLGSNTSCRLKAICELTRGEHNHIEGRPFVKMYPILLQQIHRPKKQEDMLMLFDLLEKLSGKVDFFRLQCNMNPEAARVSYEGMQKKMQ